MRDRFLPVNSLFLWFEQTLYRLRSPLIIVAVIALSGFLAQRAAPGDLVVVIGLLAALVLLRTPEFGLVVLLGATLVVPFAIGTSSQTPLNVTVLLIPALVGVWFADMFRRRSFKLVEWSVTLPLLVFIIAATVSTLAGALPWNYFARTAPLTAQLGGWAIFVMSAAVFLLVANQIHDIRWLKILTYLLFAIAAAYIVGRIASNLPGISEMMNRIASDGSLFWVWTVALASGQLAFNRQLRKPVQVLLVLLLCGMLGVAWFQARAWTSGWLPPLVALATVLTLRSWRLALFIGIAAGFVLLVRNPDLLNTLITAKAYSIMTRDVARDILIQRVLPISPLLGLGPANYYWYTPLFPILGYYVSFNSHNNYVDILAQLGIVGFACFVWVIWAVGRLGWNLRNQFAGNFEQGYVLGCLGGLAGSLAASWLADWMFPFVYNIGLNGFRASILAWIFLGGLVVLAKHASRVRPEHNQ